MTSSSRSMDWPECPVCLQPFDDRDAIPRVLACGHSVCQQCLPSLPPPPRHDLPDSLRCPACTQLVPFPRSLGPAALPKNIDLLRFSSSSAPTTAISPSLTPDHKLNPFPTPELFSLSWTRRPLYSAWKDSILPQESLAVVSDGAESDLSVASVTCPLGRPWFLRQKQLVSLFPVNCGVSYDRTVSLWFRLSYTAQVIESLSKLENKVRDELRIIIDAGFQERRGLCKVYGLWMKTKEESSQLFLVCEFYERNLSDLIKEVMPEVNQEGDDISFRLFIAKELCEAIMLLHSQGLVCGYLEPSCFCLDRFGHCLLNLNKVMITGRRVRQEVGAFASRGGGSDNPKNAAVVVSPEVLMMLRHKDAASKYGFKGPAAYSSDVWSMSYTLVILLKADLSLATEISEEKAFEDNFFKAYEVWKENVILELKSLLIGTQFASLLHVLTIGLSYDPEKRPRVSEIFHCLQKVALQIPIDSPVAADLIASENEPAYVLVLQFLCPGPTQDKDVTRVEKVEKGDKDTEEIGIVGINQTDAYKLQDKKVGGEHVKARDVNSFRSITLQGHYDCITGLAIGGGFLFSSSFDKTIKVWSLQDFSHLQTLKGHEHRIMAILVADKASDLLCITADSGSGIFLWGIGHTVNEMPLKKWYEHNDWRFSGIHSLAVSGTGYLYSGSGDKSIKAWSLQDYTLACTMMGHKSTVSALAVAHGILYSGSWDGTIRLWWLHDHSPLTVLGDDAPENFASVLSIAIGDNLLAATYENGFLKIWRNDELCKSEKVQNGAIFAVHMYNNWIFTGGWEKTINIQELPENDLETDLRKIASVTCDSVITCLLYQDSKLLVGLSNRDIKVYYIES